MCFPCLWLPPAIIFEIEALYNHIKSVKEENY